MTANSELDLARAGFPKAAISDGYNVLGTASTPVRVDPTGTTVQPVNVVAGGGTPPANAPTGGAVPADADYIGGKGPTGNLTGVSVDASGNVNAVVSGTVTANAGTNLNTSLLALEAGGNLAAIKTDSDTIAGAVSSGKMQDNIAQIAGSTVATAATGVQKVGIVGGAGTSLEATAGVLNVAPQAATAGGATPKSFHVTSNAVQAVKASAGQLYGYYLDNSANSTTAYYQIFNIASGSVSLGSSTPLIVIPVPAGLCANLSISEGLVFGTAISFAVTTTYNGSTFVASAVDAVMFYN